MSARQRVSIADFRAKLPGPAYDQVDKYACEVLPLQDGDWLIERFAIGWARR